MSASTLTDSTWSTILAVRQGDRSAPVPMPWRDLFAPLVDGAQWTVAQLGQSLDGRIATPSGHSHYVNGPEAIRHLHRLRALADAVVVGVGTALADDPRLTVRGIVGRSPARVVIDPNRRLPAAARLFADDGVPCAMIVDRRAGAAASARVTTIALPSDAEGRIAPRDIVAALHARGWRRLLIEGGAHTVSTFLAQGCLDRLHLAVAPMLIGSGPIGVNLPAIDTLGQALRPRVRHYPLGADLLFDIDLLDPKDARAGGS
jgi:diaminohydroxyphosphoribosylaminopyrimidine deaminase/5-amino-6-(5-phosphoribosylamino)uracil reductase